MSRTDNFQTTFRQVELHVYIRKRTESGLWSKESGGICLSEKNRRKKEFRTDARVENKYTHQEYEQTKRSVL